MKHLFTLLGLFSFCSLLSQERPVAHLLYRWDAQLFDWILVTEEHYQYAPNDSLTQKVYSQFEHPNVLGGLDQRYLTQYDANGNQTFALTQYRSLEQEWKDIRRVNWFVDEAGYHTQVSESFEEGEWKFSRRFRCKETLVDNFIIEDNYRDQFEEGQWVFDSHDSVHLNLDRQQINKWSFAWDGTSEWISMFAFEWEYSIYGHVTRKRQENLAQRPANYIETRWKFTYDANGDILEEVSDRRSTYKPEWANIHTQKSRYDTQRRKISEEMLYGELHNSNDQYRREYEYRGDTTLRRNFKYQAGLPWLPTVQFLQKNHPDFPSYIMYSQVDSFRNGSWKFGFSFQYDFTLDPFGLISEITREYKTSRIEINQGVRRFFHNFDDRDRLTQKVEHYYDPSFQSYVPFIKELWVYQDPLGDSQNDFTLTPQPTTGPFFINFLRQGSIPISVQIFDQGGKVLKSQIISKEEVRFGMSLQSPTQTPGLYFVRVIYEDGSSRTQKMQLI